MRQLISAERDREREREHPPDLITYLWSQNAEWSNSVLHITWLLISDDCGLIRPSDRVTSFFFFSPRPPLYSAHLCFIVRGLEGTMHQTVVQHKHSDTAHWFFFFWDALSAVSACFCLSRFFTVTKWPTQWAASGPEPLMFQTVTAAAEVRLHHHQKIWSFLLWCQNVFLFYSCYYGSVPVPLW